MKISSRQSFYCSQKMSPKQQQQHQQVHGVQIDLKLLPPSIESIGLCCVIAIQWFSIFLQFESSQLQILLNQSTASGTMQIVVILKMEKKSWNWFTWSKIDQYFDFNFFYHGFLPGSDESDDDRIIRPNCID